MPSAARTCRHLPNAASLVVRFTPSRPSTITVGVFIFCLLTFVRSLPCPTAPFPRKLDRCLSDEARGGGKLAR